MPLNFMTAFTICSDFGAQEKKSVTASTFPPSICHEVMGPDAITLVFWMLSYQPSFSLSSFTLIKRLFSSSSLSAVRVVSSASWVWKVKSIKTLEWWDLMSFLAGEYIKVLGGWQARRRHWSSMPASTPCTLLYAYLPFDYCWVISFTIKW